LVGQNSQIILFFELMKRLFAQLHNKPASRFTALFLMVWLSGAACLLSCGTMQARAALATHNEHEVVQVVEEASCPMGSHRCCHGKAEKNQETDENTASLSSPSKQTPSLDCCSPLHFVQINVAHNIKQVDTTISVPVAAIEPLKPAFKRQKVSFQQAYQPISLNRGSTYLRNCVFRI
jgi:hypothetical protein